MIKEFIQKIGEKNYLLTSTTLSLLGDLLICLYIKTKILNFEQFKELFSKTTEQMGVSAAEFPPNFINEQFFLVSQVVTLMLIIYIAIQIIHYTLYYLKKSYGKKYFISMNMVALFLSPFFIVAEYKSIWGVIFFVQTLFFIYCFLGHRIYFKAVEPKKESP